MTDGRVFGMGSDPTAEPDWPPLTLAEVDEVVAHAVAAGAGDGPGPLHADALPGASWAVLEWRSPRPLSSTVGVRLADGERVVVKRMPIALRDAAALAEEHAFMEHLRSRGVPIPAVWSCTRDGFSYEIHALGAGADLYRNAFSWSPYLSVTQAAAAGRMLARLHRAAEGYDAPPRPPRPLQAGLCTDLAATIERRAVEWPAVGEFLATQGWRADIETLCGAVESVRGRVGSPRDRIGSPCGEEDSVRSGDGATRAGTAQLRVDLSDLPPLWTHNDWHGTNLLWTGDEITAVIDFGLANRTVAVFDLATAIERFAVDWLSLRDGGPAHIHADQLAAFLRAYCAVRPLTAAERRALPALFPLVHVDYELSEIDYFLTVLPRPNHENAEIAYRDYLLGHIRWAYSASGREFLDLLSRLAAPSERLE